MNSSVMPTIYGFLAVALAMAFVAAQEEPTTTARNWENGTEKTATDAYDSANNTTNFIQQGLEGELDGDLTEDGEEKREKAGNITISGRNWDDVYVEPWLGKGPDPRCKKREFWPVKEKCVPYMGCIRKGQYPAIYSCKGKTYFDYLKRTCVEQAAARCALSGLCPTDGVNHTDESRPGKKNAYMTCKGGLPEPADCPGKTNYYGELGKCEEEGKAQPLLDAVRAEKKKKEERRKLAIFKRKMLQSFRKKT